MIKKILILAVIIVIGIFCFGGTSLLGSSTNLPEINSLNDVGIVEGEGVCDGSISINCGNPESTYFYSTSSPSTTYYEFPISGNGVISVDLSKIKWKSIHVIGGNTYSTESSNVNVSVEDYFKTAVNNTLNDSQKFQLRLDIPGLDEMDYGGQMQASEPNDEQAHALDAFGSTSVDAYRDSLGTNGYIESCSLDGNILTINVNIPQGYGYITGSHVKVDDKNATLDLTVYYNNVTYNIGFNDLKVEYNT